MSSAAFVAEVRELHAKNSNRLQLPEGKRFVFTIFDDTDSATLENVRGVYALLADLGFRTTKSCWVVDGDRNQGKFPGDTCDRQRVPAVAAGTSNPGL